MCCSLIASCLGSACMGCCCSSLKECQVKHGPGSRVPYIFIMFSLCIFAVIMTLYGDTVLWENDLLDIEVIVCDENENEACQANGSVYRVSFCLFLFFIIHAAVVKAVASFHWLFLTMKLFILIGVLVLTYFLPNDIFDGYASFARVASIVFLLLQVIILINWAYDTNDEIVGRIDNLNDKIDDESTRVERASAKCGQTALVIVTIVIYIIIITFIALFFVWFTDGCDDALPSTIISITIVLILLMTFIPIFTLPGKASLFTNAVVCFYVTYLCFAGLENYPVENNNYECNEFAKNESNATMWIGIIVTAIAISYIGFSVAKHTGNMIENDKNSEINMAELGTAKKKRGKDSGDDAGMDDTDGNTNDKSNYDDDANLGESNYDDEDKKKPRSEPDVSEDAVAIDQKANVMFHTCMAFAAIYMAMLYTNWGTNTEKTEIATGRSETSVWINIAAQWATCVLFLWTAIAPRVCPGRFGLFNEDD